MAEAVSPVRTSILLRPAGTTLSLLVARQSMDSLSSKGTKSVYLHLMASVQVDMY